MKYTEVYPDQKATDEGWKAQRMKYYNSKDHDNSLHENNRNSACIVYLSIKVEVNRVNCNKSLFLHFKISSIIMCKCERNKVDWNLNLNLHNLHTPWNYYWSIFLVGIEAKTFSEEFQSEIHTKIDVAVINVKISNNEFCLINKLLTTFRSLIFCLYKYSYSIFNYF